MEAEVSVGEAVGAVARVVGSVVVVAADEDAVVEVGGAAVVPGVEVVGFAPGAGGVASFGTTGLVADQESFALGGGEESSGAA